MNAPLVLRLNKSGRPVEWISPETTACLITKNQVLWSLGDSILSMRGGLNAQGIQTKLDIPGIIATRGQLFFSKFVPALENYLLFRRDNHLCMYCGRKFPNKVLTRDHIIPRAQGGQDLWRNVVSACQRCNNRKGARTPEQAKMPLLAVPYEPNQFEFLYLANRKILANQMDFLKDGFSNNYRVINRSH